GVGFVVLRATSARRGAVLNIMAKFLPVYMLDGIRIVEDVHSGPAEPVWWTMEDRMTTGGTTTLWFLGGEPLAHIVRHSSCTVVRNTGGDTGGIPWVGAARAHWVTLRRWGGEGLAFVREQEHEHLGGGRSRVLGIMDHLGCVMEYLPGLVGLRGLPLRLQ